MLIDIFLDEQYNIIYITLSRPVIQINLQSLSFQVIMYINGIVLSPNLYIFPFLVQIVIFCFISGTFCNTYIFKGDLPSFQGRKKLLIVL